MLRKKEKKLETINPKSEYPQKLSPALMKYSMICMLFTLIAVIVFAGVIDFVTPQSLTTFNIDDLNGGGIVTYSEVGNTPDLFANIMPKKNSATLETSAMPTVSYIPAQETLLTQQVQPNNADSETGVYTAKLFGIFPIKNVDITVFPEMHLLPGGMPFGVKFYTEGVIVVGTSDIDTDKGMSNPAKSAGIKTSDIIIAVNGAPVSTVDEIARIIEACNGETIVISIMRDEKPMTLNLKPVLSGTENKYKSGMWLRNSAAGIGTVTFVNPANYSFGGLGHGICDVDTGNLMPLKRGTVVNADIENVVKGKAEQPGELKGKFHENAGTLIANTSNGVFGIMSNSPVTIENSTPMPIGLRSDIKEGRAVILSTVDESGIKEFEIEIIKIYKNSTDSKNFLVRITDERLLEITGGIVQGMSGSPVIQDGKIIGAVTHVLVSDPSKGYGIFIDNMLASMPDILQTD